MAVEEGSAATMFLWDPGGHSTGESEWFPALPLALCWQDE